MLQAPGDFLEDLWGLNTLNHFILYTPFASMCQPANRRLKVFRRCSGLDQTIMGNVPQGNQMGQQPPDPKKKSDDVWVIFVIFCCDIQHSPLLYIPIFLRIQSADNTNKHKEKKVWRYEKSVQRNLNKLPDGFFCLLLHSSFYHYLYSVNPLSKCRLRQLRLERINDHLRLEQEFIKNAEFNKPKTEENAVSSSLFTSSAIRFTLPRKNGN